MKNQIVFFVPALSQPRCVKRISAFHKQGYKCIVYGYNRGNYDVNEYPEDVTIITLGTLEDGGGYLQKLVSARKVVSAVVKTRSKECSLYYSFGFMFALILRIKGVKFIYEISDIFYAYPKFSRIGWLLKIIDTFIIKKSYRTILTSNGFLLYYGLTDSQKIIVLPNKVSPRLVSLSSRQPLQLVSNRIRFAFVGGIRYESVYRFAETIGKFFPQHSFS